MPTCAVTGCEDTPDYPTVEHSYCWVHYAHLECCVYCRTRQAHDVTWPRTDCCDVAVCPACAVDEEHQCSQCGILTCCGRHWRRQLYCSDCYEANVPYFECCDNYGECACSNRRVHPFDWKPVPVFYDGRKADKEGQPLYFGFELEIQCYQADLEACLDVVDRPDLYCKHDGSLTDGEGFEIVSHPMSWSYLMERRHEFAGLWRQLIALGARSYDTPTCGLHIHHSRVGYTKLQLYKVQRLVCGHSEFSLRVSQRQRRRLDQYASLTAEPTGSYVRKALHGENQRVDDASRRVAVNLENEQTVEYRLFRGTLRPSGFFKAIEYVQAVYEVTRNLGIDDCTEQEFTKYVFYHRKRFPCLNYFLKHKQNLPDPKFAQLGVRPNHSVTTDLVAA